MPVVQLSEIDNLQEFDPGVDSKGNKKELEIVAMGDDTLSMRELLDPSDPNSGTKAQAEIDILSTMATDLWQLDSQAEHEAAAGLDAGGVRVVRWGRTWTDDGDWRPANLETQAAKFTFQQTTTLVMQGVAGVQSVYYNEFCIDEDTKQPTDPDTRPALLIASITDGWCFDNEKFEAFAATLGGDTFLAKVLIGSGPEYNKALTGYARVAERNDHFILLPFGTRARPRKVTDTFLRLAGKYED